MATIKKIYLWTKLVRPALVYNSAWYYTAQPKPLKSAKEYLTMFGSSCVSGIYELSTKDWSSTYYTYCDMTTLGGGWTMIFKSVQNKSNNVFTDLQYDDAYWTNRWQKNATIANMGNSWTVNVATLATENVNADTLMVYCNETMYQYYNWTKITTPFFTPSLNYTYWTNTASWRTFKDTYQNSWWFNNWTWDIAGITMYGSNATTLYTNSYQEKNYSHTYARMGIAASNNNYDSAVIFGIWLYSQWYTHANHKNGKWYQCAWVTFDDYYVSGNAGTTRGINCRIYVKEN